MAPWKEGRSLAACPPTFRKRLLCQYYGQSRVSRESWLRKKCFVHKAPNQQRTLNRLPTDLRCRNFVTKHRLSIKIGARRVKTCMQCVRIPTELPFCMPAVVVKLRASINCKLGPLLKKKKSYPSWTVLVPPESLLLLPLTHNARNGEEGRKEDLMVFP